MIKQILILADSCVCQTHKSNKKSFSAKGFHPFFSPTKKKMHIRPSLMSNGQAKKLFPLRRE